MATKKWYVVMGSEEMGPLGPRGLRKLVRAGEITADTLVRREDHTEAVPAVLVRGLLPVAASSADPGAPASEAIEGAPAPHRAHAHQRAKIHGPFTSLRALGWATAACLFAFALLGVLGVMQGMAQVRLLDDVAQGRELAPGTGAASLFGIGAFAVLALVAAGSLFLWWLWTARINLPHLINAHVHYGPSFTIAAWFVPLVNLVVPLSVVAEIDRLSAEAEADGNPKVAANHSLLVPWWVTAVAGTATGVAYLLVPKATFEELHFAGMLHFATGALALVAGILAGVIVLRVTRNQERAHDRHPEPVEVRHAHGHHGRAVPRAKSTAG